MGRIFCAVSAALAMSLCLAGCGGNKVWVKPGATQQDFATDSYACEKDARQSGYFGSGLLGQVNFNSFEARCMNARGWYLENQQSSTAFTSSPGTRVSPTVRCKVPGQAAIGFYESAEKCAADGGQVVGAAD